MIHSTTSLANSPNRVRVWDLFVRCFHWGLVLCIAGNYFVVEAGEWLHQGLGYVAVTLVVARIGWGFVGGQHARFSSFFPTPSRLRKHFADWRLARQHGEPLRHVGHNPLGAVMMLVLMALVLLLGTTGWLQTTDRFWGVEWLQDLHELLANGLIGAAGLHACAALVMGRLERTNLVAAMFTGVKIFK